MKVKCLHGYFKFQESNVGQISDFASLYGIELFPKKDFYTFEPLLDAPDYSLSGLNLLGLPAIATFEGEPWEVFEANGFIYDFSRGVMAPIASISQAVKIELAGNLYISNGLILPGSLTAEGLRVKDYSAWFSRSTLRWTYSEVTYVEST